MGFGIITQHLSFYKKHNFVQFENVIDEKQFITLETALSTHGFSGLFNINQDIFKGSLKTLVVSLAKAAIFLSCEKKLRLGGYFTLPCPELAPKVRHDFSPTFFTLSSLIGYSSLAIAAVIPLSRENNTVENTPMNPLEKLLDFSPFGFCDLFFIEASAPFILPKRPVLILPFLKENSIYLGPKKLLEPPALIQHNMECGDKLTSTTHPLVTL